MGKNRTARLKLARRGCREWGGGDGLEGGIRKATRNGAHESTGRWGRLYRESIGRESKGNRIPASEMGGRPVRVREGGGAIEGKGRGTRRPDSKKTCH